MHKPTSTSSVKILYTCEQKDIKCKHLVKLLFTVWSHSPKRSNLFNFMGGDIRRYLLFPNTHTNAPAFARAHTHTHTLNLYIHVWHFPTASGSQVRCNNSSSEQRPNTSETTQVTHTSETTQVTHTSEHKCENTRGTQVTHTNETHKWKHKGHT